MQHHLTCAAREYPLTLSEPEYHIEGWQQAVDHLVQEGDLLQSADGDAWYAARKQPHRLVNLRTIGESWTIYEQGRQNLIGTVSGGQVYGECYEGAVYLHRGRQYVINGRDPSKGQIHASEVDVPYYTRAKTEKETEILEELRSRPMAGFFGETRTSKSQFTSRRIRKSTGRRPNRTESAPPRIARPTLRNRRLLARTRHPLQKRAPPQPLSPHGVDPRH